MADGIVTKKTKTDSTLCKQKNERCTNNFSIRVGGLLKKTQEL